MTQELEIEILGTKQNSIVENDPQLSLEELLTLPHPIEQHPELLDLIEELFPNKGYKERLLLANRPTISDNPDEMEKWETEVILRRKQMLPVEKISNQPNLAYLIRLLYEETFSVRQFAGKKNGSQGTTLGGLLSHHLFFGSVNGISLNSIKELEIVEKSFKAEFERLVKINDFKSLEKLVKLATKIGLPSNYYMPEYASRIRETMLRTKNYFQLDMVEQMGYRAILILHENQDLLKNNSDPTLKEICASHNDSSILYFLHRLWGILSKNLFLEGGYYKTSIDSELLKFLEKLIIFRTHPDTQILYKYLSPSGYINSKEAT